MPAFEYRALDHQGQEKKGILEADTARQVRQQLRAQGLSPTVVEAIAEANKGRLGQKSRGASLGQGRAVQHHEMVLVTRQLATLIESGLPIEEALLGVSEQSERPKVSSMMMAIRSRVLEGHPLAVGFADFPQVFSDMYRATVAAGEESGHLDKVLERLADYTEKQQILRQKVTSAAIYPAAMIFVSVGIVTFLLAYVVPQLISLFEDSGQTLPPLTLFMIAVSHGVQAHGLTMAVVLIALGVTVKILLRKPTIRFRWHAQLLAWPVIGKASKTINTARFARTFGILSSAGVPVLEAMHAAAQVVANLFIREKIEQAAEKVREGVPISGALKESGVFPPMSIHLIATGESGGRLDAMLTKAADTQERAVEALINRAVTLFEPLMTLVMGGVILLIVLSVLLPIFALSQNT